MPWRPREAPGPRMTRRTRPGPRRSGRVPSRARSARGADETCDSCCSSWQFNGQREADGRRTTLCGAGGVHSSKPRCRLRFLGVTGVRPWRSVPRGVAPTSVLVGLLTPELGLPAFSSSGPQGRLDNGRRGEEPLGTRLQRRDRSGFTPDSLFAGRRRPRPPATNTRSSGDHTATTFGCQIPAKSGGCDRLN
jgi:hypothetical protein